MHKSHHVCDILSNQSTSSLFFLKEEVIVKTFLKKILHLFKTHIFRKVHLDDSCTLVHCYLEAHTSILIGASMDWQLDGWKLVLHRLMSATQLTKNVIFRRCENKLLETAWNGKLPTSFLIGDDYLILLAAQVKMALLTRRKMAKFREKSERFGCVRGLI